MHNFQVHLHRFSKWEHLLFNISFSLRYSFCIVLLKGIPKLLLVLKKKMNIRVVELIQFGAMPRNWINLLTSIKMINVIYAFLTYLYYYAYIIFFLLSVNVLHQCLIIILKISFGYGFFIPLKSVLERFIMYILKQLFWNKKYITIIHGIL